MLKGVDVSDWQPDIDWAAARAAGVSFAIFKATQGTRHVQDTFAPNRKAAPAAGIGPLGFYHFAQDGNPTLQADHFGAVVGQLGPDEFAVLDIEANPDYFSIPVSQWPGFIVAWCEQVEQRIGGPVVVYMSESPAGQMPASVARWPLWVAGYQKRTPTAWEDWRVGPWTSPVIWQWSSSGTVPGIGGTDENIAPDDLRDRLGLTSSPPAPVPVPTPPVPEEDTTMRLIGVTNNRGIFLVGTEPLPTGKAKGKVPAVYIGTPEEVGALAAAGVAVRDESKPDLPEAIFDKRFVVVG